MRCFQLFEGRDSKCSRGAFSETEVRSLLAAARPHERSLIGIHCFAGLRPGDAYGLDWPAVDLEAGQLSVQRSWDYRRRVFVEPKSKTGIRQVSLSSWLVTHLAAHKERSTGEGLVFASRTGTPLNRSNVRRDFWLKLRERAGVRALDLYSLRHTDSSLERTAGENQFNVSRMTGHKTAASSISYTRTECNRN